MISLKFKNKNGETGKITMSEKRTIGEIDDALNTLISTLCSKKEKKGKNDRRIHR